MLGAYSGPSVSIWLLLYLAFLIWLLLDSDTIWANGWKVQTESFIWVDIVCNVVGSLQECWKTIRLRHAGVWAASQKPGKTKKTLVFQTIMPHEHLLALCNETCSRQCRTIFSKMSFGHANQKDNRTVTKMKKLWLANLGMTLIHKHQVQVH